MTQTSPKPHVPGWAVYLACSWTWCIGMFLPVLMLRDYGPISFAVFAIPNVLGAAAMGWVLRSRDSSVRVVREHARACIGFSLVTVAFHAFFVGFLATLMAGVAPALALALAASGVVLLLVGTRLGVHAASYLALLVSLSVFGAMAFQGKLGMLDVEPTRGPMALLWVAPVCVFGFLLCPYLDLTFHRARQSLDAGPAKAAFGLGFGVVFLAMILFTLAYSRVLGDGVWGAGIGPVLASGLTLVVIHIANQACLTCGLHLNELRRGGALAGLLPKLILLIALLGALAAGGLAGQMYEWNGQLPGIVVYKVFMSFYGLVFPAYVWLVMIPRAWTPSPQMRRRVLLIWAFAVGIAAPMYWMGFVQGQEFWLAPALLVVLLARLTLPRRAT